MADKALDFYMKGLPIDVRQAMHDYLRNEISETMIGYLLERDFGYPSFRSMGFSDDDILLIGESYAERFRFPNQLMIENGRAPLFSDPDDPYRSALEYREMWMRRSPEELADIFGCAFQEYVPTALRSSDADR